MTSNTNYNTNRRFYLKYDEIYNTFISPIRDFILESYENISEHKVSFLSLIFCVLLIPTAFWIYMINPYKKM